MQVRHRRGWAHTELTLFAEQEKWLGESCQGDCCHDNNEDDIGKRNGNGDSNYHHDNSDIH